MSSLISLFLLHLIPLVLLSVMNALTFIKVRKSSKNSMVNNRRKRDLDVATALSIIVFIFIICHSFKFAINLVEFLDMFQGNTVNVLNAFISHKKNKLKSLTLYLMGYKFMQF